jgi:hypothetical protein
MSGYNGSLDDAPEPVMITLPRWPGLLARARHGDERQWVSADAVYTPDELVDMRCRSCRAGCTIVPDPVSEVLLLIVGHHPSSRRSRTSWRPQVRDEHRGADGRGPS